MINALMVDYSTAEPERVFHPASPAAGDLVIARGTVLMPPAVKADRDPGCERRKPIATSRQRVAWWRRRA